MTNLLIKRLVRKGHLKVNQLNHRKVQYILTSQGLREKTVNPTTPLFKFFKRICAHRSVIRLMAVQEIRNRYAGTLAGSVWSIINPLMIIFIYWFVFSVGFKVRLAGTAPFIVVFLCGLIPWMMFNETLTTSANIVAGNAHLIKKTVFPAEILPVISLVASSISHGIMLIILMVLLLLNKISLSLYNIQFLYYLESAFKKEGVF